MQRLRLFLVFGGLFVAALAVVAIVLLGTRHNDTYNQTGTASIGGPFSLTDQTGHPVTDKDFKGKFMLVLFGYTYCPDVCPTELQTISQALDEMGGQADQVAPLFISVDPERDNTATLATYMSNFNPRIKGLTGSKSEIDAAVKAYRVYAKKTEPSETLSGYTVDHSAFIYLMDREGKFITYFSFGTTPKTIIETLKKEIAAHPVS